MSTAIPRLRMFAGPNGSGKSTLKSVVPPALVGIYINPDEIEASVKQLGGLDFASMGFTTTTREIQSAFRTSAFLQSVGLADTWATVSVEGTRLICPAENFNSYLASVTADFIRHKLLEVRQSFTFETVMSARDKVDFLATARAAGYRTYLYFIATEDPAINIARVRNRVASGGHSVPEEKIITRYERSLGLLMDAIRQTDRAYIFDNSQSEHVWLAEITNGRSIRLNVEQLPAWFQRAVWNKRL